MVLFLFQGCDKSLSQHPRNSPCQVLVLLRIRNLNERRRIWPQAQHPVAPQKKTRGKSSKLLQQFEYQSCMNYNWFPISPFYHRVVVCKNMMFLAFGHSNSPKGGILPFLIFFQTNGSEFSQPNVHPDSDFDFGTKMRFISSSLPSPPRDPSGLAPEGPQGHH